MAGVLKEAALTTAKARSRLAAGIYWRSIDPQTHLGYRRRERPDGSGAAGFWMVRWYVERPKYRQEMIGAADDALKADGMHTYSYEQAAQAARKIVQTRRAEAMATAAGEPVTVRSAIDEYLKGREEREGRSAVYAKRDARSRLSRHVLANEKLAGMKLAMLTEADLATWRDGLADMAPGTVRRLANDFKAALNRAAATHRARLPERLAGIIKNGLAVSEASGGTARPDQVLPDDDVRRILAAARWVDADGEWGGDLFRLVCVLAATGARFSQVVRMTVADVQPEHGRLMVPVSHKGRGNKAARHTPVQVGDDVIEALQPAVAGRKKAEPLFMRPHWKKLSGPRERIGRGPWKVSAEITRPWQDIIKRAELPSGTVPYSLRHSSIVRGIRVGLPNRLVASVHDTSTAMIERHYAAFIAGAMDELARRAVMPGLVPRDADAKVIPLARRP